MDDNANKSQSPPAVTAADPENFIDTYQVIAEWIRFADAKAAAVLTVCGALAGVLIPTLRGFLDDTDHITSWWTALGVVLFVLWLITLLASCVWSFRCIIPFRKGGRHPALGKCSHFHPAAIAASYTIDETDRFISDSEGIGQSGLIREVMAGILLDAHISAAKYTRVTRAIKLLALSAVLGFLYLVVLQF